VTVTVSVSELAPRPSRSLGRIRVAPRPDLRAPPRRSFQPRRHKVRRLRDLYLHLQVFVLPQHPGRDGQPSTACQARPATGAKTAAAIGAAPSCCTPTAAIAPTPAPTSAATAGFGFTRTQHVERRAGAHGAGVRKRGRGAEHALPARVSAELLWEGHGRCPAERGGSTLG
jgi:hypothetical protein